MGNESLFTIKSTVEIKFSNSQLCEIAYNSYIPEFNIKKSKRSEVKLEKLNESLIFTIESEDITAFRAAINEIVSFGKIVEGYYSMSITSK